MRKTILRSLLLIGSIFSAARSFGIDLNQYDVHFFYNDPKSGEYWLGLTAKTTAEQTTSVEVFFGKSGELESMGVAKYWHSPLRSGLSTYTLNDSTVITIPGFHDALRGEKADVKGIRGIAKLEDLVLNSELLQKVAGSQNPVFNGTLLLPVQKISEPKRSPYALYGLEGTNDFLILFQSITDPNDVVGYVGNVGLLQPLGEARYWSDGRRGGRSHYLFADGAILELPGFNNQKELSSFTNAVVGKKTIMDLKLNSSILKNLLADDCSSAVK